MEGSLYAGPVVRSHVVVYMAELVRLRERLTYRFRCNGMFIVYVHTIQQILELLCWNIHHKPWVVYEQV